MKSKLDQQLQEHLISLDQIDPGREREAHDLLAPFATLPAFLRALLVADGTVTLLLSAYFSERIQVTTLDQSLLRVPAPARLPALGLEPGDEVFYRRVELFGSVSNKQYASAVSLLNPKALDPDLFDKLIDEYVGMGEVLRNSARGSYREVLDVRQRTSHDVDRTYTVFLEGHPAILITERFKVECFQ